MSIPMPPGPPPIQQPAKPSIWNKKLGGADGLFGWNRLAFANSATRREAKALLFQELAEAVRHDMPLDEALSLAMRSDGETGPKPVKPEGDALSSVTMMLYVLFLSVGGIILLMLISAWASDVERVARVLAHRLLPLIRFGLQPGLAWAIHKEVLVRRGLITCAAVRAPARPVDDWTRAWLDDVLTDLGVAQGLGGA